MGTWVFIILFFIHISRLEIIKLYNLSGKRQVIFLSEDDRNNSEGTWGFRLEAIELGLQGRGTVKGSRMFSGPPLRKPSLGS